MNLLSASSLQRIDACPPSAVLSRIYSTGAPAERGNEIHAFLAKRSQGASVEEALASVPEEHRTVCTELPDPGRGEVEMAYAYDVVTGKVRVLGSDIARQYGKLAPTEIPGTADLQYMAGDAVCVDDYKTGRTEVPPARDNLQLHFLALCATKACGATKARVALVHIREDGSTYRDSHDLDAFDLAETAARVRKVYDRVKYAQKDVDQGKTPALHEGAWCKYCPAKAACPAKVGWLVRLTVPEGIKQKFGTLLTAEAAPKAYEMVERIGEIYRDLQGQLFAWARENPIELGDGRVFGLTTSERESVDGKIAWEVLEKIHGFRAADLACELSATKASIERALKEIAPRGQLAAMKRAALKAIEEAGGIEVKKTETVKAYTPEALNVAKAAGS